MLNLQRAGVRRLDGVFIVGRSVSEPPQATLHGGVCTRSGLGGVGWEICESRSLAPRARGDMCLRLRIGNREWSLGRRAAGFFSVYRRGSVVGGPPAFRCCP